jgi:hypothetical protein
MGIKIRPRTWTQSSFLYQFQNVQGSFRIEKSFLDEILGISLICLAIAGVGMSSKEDAAEEAIERRSIASLSLLYSLDEDDDDVDGGEGRVEEEVVVLVEEEDLVMRLDGAVMEPILLCI